MNALICGVTGQDGAYLAKLLLHKGYKVFGTSRDVAGSSRRNLRLLGIDEEIQYLTLDVTDYKSVLTALQSSQPEEIYNLSGQSSVSISYELPFETIRSFTLGVLNIMEGMRFLGLNSRLFNASSGECFGETGAGMATENTAFSPKSPYAVAKASAHWSVQNYRDAYGLHACSGILFSHESPLRNRNFVSRKIISVACGIKRGEVNKLTLGNIDICRDWGWAPEFVEAIWLMLQQEHVADYVLCTGAAYTLRDFVRLSFEAVGLEYSDYLEISKQFLRPNDIMHSVGSPEKAKAELGWRAEFSLPQIVEMMVEAEFSGQYQ